MKLSNYKKIIFFLTVLGLFLYKIAWAQENRWGISLFTNKNEFFQGTGTDVIINIVLWFMSFIFLVSAAFIVYGAVIYVTSGGSEEQVKRAKTVLLYAIIGLVVAILTIIIVRTIPAILGQ